MKDPIIVGALGGSGTRVVARIVQRLGVFIGDNRNESEDAMDFVPFYDRWINSYTRSRLGEESVDLDLMGLEFAECVAAHRSHIPDDKMEWGWKEPRSIYLLPFFHLLYPGMRFVHVIRDGRDMAFSSNQNQLRLHGPTILADVEAGLPQPVRTAVLWSRVNSTAADYAEDNLADRYLTVLFEDLCDDPLSTVARIVDFLVPGSEMDVSSFVSQIAAPSSIGRWRACPDEAILQAIGSAAGEALIRFGYE